MAASTLAAVVADPAGTLLALDFDGTLSHIVDDPSQAFAHARSVAAMARLGEVLGQVAIVTGRPVDQAIELGGFAGRAGLERLVIHGQYGAETWTAEGAVHARPERPAGIEQLAQRLPGVLDLLGLGELRIEDKGLAIAIHTREIGGDAFDILRTPLHDLAAELGLTVEPGRQVIELRAPGTDKGDAVRRLVSDLGARQVIYAGDDLGDLPAFEAIADLRADGVAGLLICSASAEQDALVALADVVLAGPDAVADWLEALANKF